MRDRKWYETKLKEVYDVFDDAVERRDLDILELECLRQELFRCHCIIELAVNDGMNSDIVDRFKEAASQLDCYLWKRWL